jgi:excisionase family DNA binding protein
MPGPRLLNVAQAATYIGRSEKAIRMMVQRKLLPHVRQGRRLQFDPRALEAWIERHSIVLRAAAILAGVLTFVADNLNDCGWA